MADISDSQNYITKNNSSEESSEQLDLQALNTRYPVSLKEKLEMLTTSPGCYLMKNADNKIIYVGKAKNLRNRVRQYFQKGADLTRRKRQMVYEIHDLEWIATDTEIEALILENNLIKKHAPVYNVRLRDDKSYPYISITLSEEWPRIVYTRKLHMKSKEVDKYYGPYTDTEAVRETLKIIRRVFHVPCGYKDPTKSKGKACMYYHIDQCLGPCADKISKEDYMSVIQEAMFFLEGRSDKLVDELLEKMQTAAENLEFEKAAKLRDQVTAIQKLSAKQKVISTTLNDRDVIAIVSDEINTCAEMFFIRGGKLIGQEHFLLENTVSDDIGEAFSAFLTRYYETSPYIPPEILLNNAPDDIEIIQAWLKQKKCATVDISVPKRGEKRNLMDMVKKNAELVLSQIKLKMSTDTERISTELITLQNALKTPTLPKRIEAYDISNIQGYHTVASLVVFENGQPKKEHYRKFKIRRPEGKPDDFASMKETLTRRLGGSLRKTAAFANLPDLILIDGGKGQLNAAIEAAKISEQNVQLMGLAKRYEEIYRPGSLDPIILPRDSKALHLLQRIRDEAHRFAVTYHRSLRSKELRASVLNNIEGIGSKRKSALIKHFGSIEKIKNSSLDELIKAPQMTVPSANAVYNFFKNYIEEK